MIPKDITGKELVKKLGVFGYEAIRQNGSHIRIQTAKNGKHSETVPNHDPIFLIVSQALCLLYLLESYIKKRKLLVF